jgi:uncharacterized protein (TIGR00725 family)
MGMDASYRPQRFFFSPLVAVIGGSVAEPEFERLACEVGREIARRGAVLICGGGAGVMEAACRGAKEEGGLTIGVLPGTDRGEANPWVDLPIVTGLRQARNVIIVRTAHAAIAVDGAYGTLTEIAYALHFGMPVVGLGTWRITSPDEPQKDPLIRAATAAEAVCLALGALESGN